MLTEATAPSGRRSQQVTRPSWTTWPVTPPTVMVSFSRSIRFRRRMNPEITFAKVVCSASVAARPTTAETATPERKLMGPTNSTKTVRPTRTVTTRNNTRTRRTEAGAAPLSRTRWPAQRESR